jgi:hypothetical protein
LAYVGAFDVQMDGQNSTYAQGLTLRYVNGDLRLLQLTLSTLCEFSLAGKNYGDLISTPTNQWDIRTPFGPGQVNDHNGIYFDAINNRLMHVSAPDYNINNYPAWMNTCTLNPDGSVSNWHEVYFGTLPCKRVYGGVQPVPARWQAQFGGKPYVIGWGGYTSLVSQSGGASLGPAMYGVPDPAGYPHQATVPDASLLKIMDTAPAGQNRGVRVTIPLNYYDGGAVQGGNQSQTTRPNYPPLASGSWLSPTAQGLGWMVWGDSYFNTGMWIETPTRYGFVAIASLGGGENWYGQSTLHCDFRQFEWHVFDPATMGTTGRPTAMAELVVPGLGTRNSMGVGSNWGVNEVGALNGAAFDPTTNRIYVMGTALDTNGSLNRLYVFQLP